MAKTVFITGCSRGLGLEFVRQYLRAGWRVFASCRDPSSAPALTALVQAHASQAELLELDVTDSDQVSELTRHFGNIALDVLINNAGIDAQLRGRFGATDVSSWLDTLRVNAIAPLKIMEALVDAVARSELKLMVNITSRLGSIDNNLTGGSYVYRSSKAALNAVVKSAAIDLKLRGICVVALHPGWVRTDMGGSEAPLSAAASVTQMRCLIRGLGLDHSGRFLGPEGEALGW